MAVYRGYKPHAHATAGLVTVCLGWRWSAFHKTAADALRCASRVAPVMKIAHPHDWISTATRSFFPALSPVKGCRWSLARNSIQREVCRAHSTSPCIGRTGAAVLWSDVNHAVQWLQWSVRYWKEMYCVVGRSCLENVFISIGVKGKATSVQAWTGP